MPGASPWRQPGSYWPTRSFAASARLDELRRLSDGARRSSAAWTLEPSRRRPADTIRTGGASGRKEPRIMKPRVCFVVDSGTDVRLADGLAEAHQPADPRPADCRRVARSASHRGTS